VFIIFDTLLFIVSMRVFTHRIHSKHSFHAYIVCFQDTRTVPRHMAEDGVTMSAQPPGVISRVRHKVRTIAGEQEKWKGTVQEQRRNIYDRHNMLN